MRINSYEEFLSSMQHRVRTAPSIRSSRHRAASTSRRPCGFFVSRVDRPSTPSARRAHGLGRGEPRQQWPSVSGSRRRGRWRQHHGCGQEACDRRPGPAPPLAPHRSGRRNHGDAGGRSAHSGSASSPGLTPQTVTFDDHGDRQQRPAPGAPSLASPTVTSCGLSASALTQRSRWRRRQTSSPGMVLVAARAWTQPTIWTLRSSRRRRLGW
jgi:hypothetical protein